MKHTRKYLTVALLVLVMTCSIALASRSNAWSKVAVDPVYKPIPIDTYYRAADGDAAARSEINNVFERWDRAFLVSGSSWLPGSVYTEFKRRLLEEPRKMRLVRICHDCAESNGLKWDRFSEVVFGRAKIKVRHNVRAVFDAPAPGLATTIRYEGKVYHLATSVLCSNLVWFYGEPTVKPRLPARNPAEFRLPPRLPKRPADRAQPKPESKRIAFGAVAEYADYSEATADLSVGGLSGNGTWILGAQLFVEEPATDNPVRPSMILTLGGTGNSGTKEGRGYLRIDPQVRFGDHLIINAGLAYTKGPGGATLFVNPTFTGDFPYIAAELAKFDSKTINNDSLEPDSKVSRARVGAKIDEIFGGWFENTHGFFITAGVGHRKEAHNFPDGTRREVTTAKGVEGYLQVYKCLWEKKSFDRVNGSFKTDVSSYLWLEGNYGMLRTKQFDQDSNLISDTEAPAYNMVVRFGIKF